MSCGHVATRPAFDDRVDSRKPLFQFSVPLLLTGHVHKGHASVDHVHLFGSCPPHVSASYLMQQVKGKSSRRLLQEYSHPNKQCWDRHLWARGSFVASSGNVTDEVIIESIRTQELTKDDDDFRVGDG